MVTLQDRMNSMSPYFRAIEVYNNALMVRVEFPSNWKVYNRADEKIKVTPSEVNPNEAIYYGDGNEVTYDDIFDLIEQTIKANQDIILKLQLLQTKVEELKSMFSTMSYEELKTLRFVTESVKKDKPKRKYTKRKKEAPEPLNEATEASVDNNVEEILNDETNNAAYEIS